MRRDLLVSIALALLAVPAGCTKQINPIDELWLPASAVIDSQHSDGENATIQFTYQASDPMSAKGRLTSQLTKNFAEHGWRMRDMEWLNPGLATSFRDGWAPAGALTIPKEDQEGSFRRETYQWTGEWENSDLDIVTYRLVATRFEGDPAYPALNELQGTAMFYSARTIQTELSRIEKRRRR